VFPQPRAQFGLLLSDLDRHERVEAAQAVISSLAVPWLVLAGTPRGPSWGAMYERGAVLVMPTSSGLEAVTGVIDSLAEGKRITTKRNRRELVREWREYAAERRELTDRMSLLSGREEDVLRKLYAGEPVRAIAEEGEVTEATVRSQVKSILRKLQVNSQLAAVAALEVVHDDEVP
jgi:DNA-binding NarL/FixJ family response regulator